MNEFDHYFNWLWRQFIIFAHAQKAKQDVLKCLCIFQLKILSVQVCFFVCSSLSGNKFHLQLLGASAIGQIIGAKTQNVCLHGVSHFRNDIIDWGERRKGFPPTIWKIVVAWKMNVWMKDKIRRLREESRWIFMYGCVIISVRFEI